MTEKSCNDFVKEIRDAGFDFTFTATNGELAVKGKCSKGIIETEKTPKQSSGSLRKRLGLA